MKRTDDQKQAFAKECRAIEKAGGDVLEHIRVNWPSYTPRATWYNLQMQFLNRKPGHLTEGKPKVTNVTKITKEETRVKKRDLNELLDKVLQVLEKHGDPKQLIRDEGYASPDQQWCYLKAWARTHRPEDSKKLPNNLTQYYAEHGIQNAKKTPPPPPKPAVPPQEPPKAGEPLGEPERAAETVIMNGKEYEKMEKPSPTCCQPAKPSGVTVPDELPGDQKEHMPAKEYRETVKFEPKVPEGAHSMLIADEINAWPEKVLTVCAVMSNVKKTARYENSTLHAGSVPYMSFVWRDDVSKEEKQLNLPASTWAGLAKEIPLALRQLGLNKKGDERIG